MKKSHFCFFIVLIFQAGCSNRMTNSRHPSNEYSGNFTLDTYTKRQMSGKEIFTAHGLRVKQPPISGPLSFDKDGKVIVTLFNSIGSGPNDEYGDYALCNGESESSEFQSVYRKINKVSIDLNDVRNYVEGNLLDACNALEGEVVPLDAENNFSVHGSFNKTRVRKKGSGVLVGLIPKKRMCFYHSASVKCEIDGQRQYIKNMVISEKNWLEDKIKRDGSTNYANPQDVFKSLKKLEDEL